LQASPAGEQAGIEDVALVIAARLHTGTETKDLAKITGAGDQGAVAQGGKAGHLIGAGLEQIGVVAGSVGDGQHASFVAGAGNKLAISSAGGEGQRVNQAIARTTPATRSAISSDSVNIGAAG